jgi:hypothetical protein
MQGPMIIEIDDEERTDGIFDFKRPETSAQDIDFNGSRRF